MFFREKAVLCHKSLLARRTVLCCDKNSAQSFEFFTLKQHICATGAQKKGWFHAMTFQGLAKEEQRCHTYASADEQYAFIRFRKSKAMPKREQQVDSIAIDQGKQTFRSLTFLLNQERQFLLFIIHTVFYILT